MKTITGILVASTIAVAGACGSSGAYYYDPYYGYYPVAYDDYYYDATMVSGYYYDPSYYYYAFKTEAATVTVVPPAVRLLLQRWNVAIDPACLSATTSAGDTDKDGIDVNSTISFQCSSTPAGGGTAQATGSVTVKDLNDADPLAGYSITFNGFTVRVVTAGGAVTQRVVNGTEAIQKVDAGLRLNRDIIVDAIDTYPDNIQRQSKLDTHAQGVFTPEIVAGNPRVTTGTLQLSGQATFTGADGVVVTLTRQTDPTLHWNNDCTKITGNQGPYDRGAIVNRSSQGRELRIAYSSCTSSTVTRNPLQ
jgi:hypothetical protein